MSRPTCETCPFWVTYDDPSIGECRRGHPVAPTTARQEHELVDENLGILEGMFPTTSDDMWCGEHPNFQAWIDQGAKP